jgi:hypothetical protein
MGLPNPIGNFIFWDKRLPSTPVKIPVIRASEKKKGNWTKKKVCFIRKK